MNSTTTPFADSDRLHAVDSVRGVMMLLGILLHAALPYMETVRIIFQDPHRHIAFDALVYFIHSFRMPVFFLIAGFFAASLQAKCGTRGLLFNRGLRIVLPLLLAWLFISPLTRAAYIFAKDVAASLSVESGLEAVIRRYRFNPGAIYHLWFLVVLTLCYLSAILAKFACRFLSRSNASRLAHILHASVTISGWPLLWAVVLAALLVPLEFMEYHARSRFLMGMLLVFFAVGWLIHAYGDLSGLAARAWTNLIIALILMPFGFYCSRLSLEAAELGNTNTAVAVGAGLLNALIIPMMTCGVIGTFITYGRHPSRIMRYLSDASYWMYLTHMPIVIAMSGLLIPFPIALVAKMSVAFAITFGLTLISYHFCVRYSWIGVLLNGRRYQNGSVSLPAF